MNYKVPVISGDGIGPEIIAEGQKVLEAAQTSTTYSLEWIDYSIGAEHLSEDGELIRWRRSKSFQAIGPSTWEQ